MTDHPITPNDLSHLSDDEFIALCPQGEHAPGPEPLSPAAQAVWSTYESILEYECVVTKTDMKALAAALRVVADQVVPRQPEPTEKSVGLTIDYGYAWALFSKANDVRQELIAIADELEALDD